MILYKVHVRGYTKQAKLPASVRGTFLGLTKMIPYWKELGINAVELMPAYEFEEISATRQEEGLVALRSKETRINYWGYTSGYYFAPKSSYCATRDPEKEFREMIKAFHSAGIACIMEMVFFRKILVSLQHFRHCSSGNDTIMWMGFMCWVRGYRRKSL